MLIDIITVVLVLVAVFKGLRKGFVVAVFSLVAYFIGLAAALKLSTLMAGYIGSNIEVSQRWLPFLAFFLVFVIVVLLVNLGAKAIEGMMKMMMLGWLNRIAGVILYTVIYFFIYSILLFYFTQLHMIKEDTIRASATYSYIEPLGPKMINILGSIIPFFKNMFAELLTFFEKVKS